MVDAVVGVDGRVSDVRISRSLDKTFGLDRDAVTALKTWVFEPGTLNGSPVPVIVSVGLPFRLH